MFTTDHLYDYGINICRVCPVDVGNYIPWETESQYKMRGVFLSPFREMK